MTADDSDDGLAEERFRLAVEACSNGMVMIDGNGKMVMVNTEIELQFNYHRTELIGQPVNMLIPARLREKNFYGTGTLNSALESTNLELCLDLFGMRKDGSEFPIEVRLTKIRTGKGPALVLGMIVDISARRATEVHLAQMESKYRGLLEAAPDAMVVVNDRGEIVLLNLQVEKQFGYSRDELLGQDVANIIPEGFAERLAADALRSAEDALAQQIETGIELQGRRKDGSEFPIEIMLSPLASAEGTLVTAAIRDISVRKRIERLKDEFVSTVSHELRTPMTSISGSLGLLVEQWADVMPESAVRLLTIANKNSQRLVRLINDILDIEKLEAGRVAFNLGRVEILPLVKQTIDANRGFAEGYRVRVRLDATSVNAEVIADPDRLAQVITNLLSNAIKFSPPGEEVLVMIDRSGDSVRISVRDHGCGIPPDFKPQVFEKFAQADATSSKQKGGTGLGLSIVKQIVKRLHGEVGFHDAPGGGTLFYVELPAAEQAADWEVDDDAVPGSIRILICEDDRETALAMRKRLGQAGFAVDVTYTAAAARSRAAAEFYAAVLIDLQLPDDDGVSLILNLRAQKRYHDTPILVVSIDPIRGRDDVRSAKINVLSWFSKPVDFRQLILVLNKSIASETHKRPCILHVDDDRNVLNLVANAFSSLADVISVDSLKSARRAILTNHIDMALLDISIGTKSGLDLLPDLHDDGGNPIPVIILSARETLIPADGKIEVVLTKSQASLKGLVEIVCTRLTQAPAHISRSIA